MHLHRLFDGSASLSEICPQESSLTTLLRQVLGARWQAGARAGAARADRPGAAGSSRRPAAGIVEISEGSAFVRHGCLRRPRLQPRRLHLCQPVSGSRWTRSSAGSRNPSRASRRACWAASHWQAGTSDRPLAACAIALVTLDFSSVEQAFAALEHARLCLAPGGSLIVIGQHPARWIDFVFGARRAGWQRSPGEHWLSNQRSQLLLAGTTEEHRFCRRRTVRVLARHPLRTLPAARTELPKVSTRQPYQPDRRCVAGFCWPIQPATRHSFPIN
jgi:phthiocerol/phenolphthiocerol synthesis type-I polyketide synthase C